MPSLAPRLAMRRTVKVETPFDWCMAHLASHLDRVSKQLYEQGGVAGWWRGLDIPAELSNAFERAYGDDSWGFALPPEIIFPESLWPLRIAISAGPSRWGHSLKGAEDLAVLREAISGDWRDMDASASARRLAYRMLESGILRATEPRPIAPKTPGVYRLQHAGALIVGTQATVLVDPVGEMGSLWPDMGDLADVDAVLISHSHGDHYSLSTLMQFRRDTPIIVPRVVRGSLLARPMGDYLRAAGFTRVLEPLWGERVTIGDVVVHVTPFLGEQPWISMESPEPDLRNVGNTYLVDCCGQKLWFLVDAGQEASGSMVEVARDLRDELGGIDVVFSNLRDFFWHPRQIDGSGRYLFCFPKAFLANPRAWPFQSLLTLGPAGVADVIRASGARMFLPYAHWFQPPGQTVMMDGEMEEAKLVEDVAARVSAKGGDHFVALNWSIGDGYGFEALASPSPQRLAFSLAAQPVAA